jgi:PDZ domain-containing protein
MEPSPRTSERDRSRITAAVAHPFRIALFAVLGLAAVAAVSVRIPYYAEGPGPAHEVTPLIRFDDRPRYDPGGRLLWTTVQTEPLTPLGAAMAWLDPNREVIPEDVLYPPGVSREQEAQRSISQMDSSKLDAATVVLGILEDYPGDHGAGALETRTVPGCPADGELFPGDVIVEIDGRPIGSQLAASRAIGRAEAGETLDFVVDVDGEREEASFVREPCGNEDELLVGVALQDGFPFDVAIETGDVGGPSAGLMWAVGLYELLTPDDLTAGRTIAGTGTIDFEGNVGPIGGIRDKVVAAERAGATLFLAPADNLPELAGVDTGDMRVVPVRTFDEALDALEAPPTA